MITVKVVRQSSGDSVQGKRVSLSFDAIGRGSTNAEYTDRNGEAHFNVENGQGKVYVDGSTVHRGQLSGRIVVYI